MTEDTIFVFHCRSCGEHVVCGVLSRVWHAEAALAHSAGVCKK